MERGEREIKITRNCSGWIFWIGKSKCQPWKFQILYLFNFNFSLPLPYTENSEFLSQERFSNPMVIVGLKSCINLIILQKMFRFWFSVVLLRDDKIKEHPNIWISNGKSKENLIYRFFINNLFGNFRFNPILYHY